MSIDPLLPPQESQDPGPEFFEPVLPPSVPEQEKKSGPWEFWATLWIGLVIAFVWMVSQFIFDIGYFFIRLSGEAFDRESSDRLLKGIEHDGLMIRAASLGALPIILAGCIFFAWLRRNRESRSVSIWRSVR